MAFIWVNNVTGNDATGDGSETKPYKTIQKAVTEAVQGDVVKVVKTAVPYSGVGNYNVPIGAAFGGSDWDYDWGLIIEGHPQTSWPTISLDLAGGNAAFKFQAGCDYVSVRNFKFTCIDSAGVNPYAVYCEKEAGHVRCECLDCGTLPWYAVTSILITGTGSADIDLEVRCCFANQRTGVVAGNRRFIATTQPVSSVTFNHCVVKGQYHASFSSVGSGSHGTWTIFHNTYIDLTQCHYWSGFNSTGTISILDNIYYNAGVANHCPNILGGTVSFYNDYSTYWNTTTCTNCALCRTSDDPSGLYGVNPDFTGGPAWEWIYGLYLPTNYEPTNPVVLRSSSTRGCPGACRPFAQEPCLCAKPVPPPPCEPCELGDCNYGTFAGNYPDDWQAAFAKPSIPALVKVVCYDPEGESPMQLTPYVGRMRPLTQKRDIELGQWSMSDIDLELIDVDALFDSHNPASVLYNAAWFGKHVDIGVWMVGTERVLALARMFLVDTWHEAGKTNWRLTDAFGYMLAKKVRANAAGVVAVNNSSGLGTFNESKIVVDESRCKQERWTLTFIAGTQFTVDGSKTGRDGVGSTVSGYTGSSGSFSIPATAWGGSWTTGDVVTFRTGMRYTYTNVITAARDMLENLVDIPASWIDDASWDEVEAMSDAHRITIWVDSNPDALSMLRELMKHRLATAYPDHQGKIAVLLFEPSPTTIVTKCVGKRWSLMDLKAKHLPILNVISVESGYGEGSSASAGATYPPEGETNESVERYNFEFPYDFTLRGYTSADVVLLESLCERIYQMRAGLPYSPREYYETTQKAQDLNTYVGEVIYLESEPPTRNEYGMVFDIEKDTDGRVVRAKLLNVTDYITAPAGCGYAYCGGAGRTDTCKVYGY